MVRNLGDRPSARDINNNFPSPRRIISDKIESIDIYRSERHEQLSTFQSQLSIIDKRLKEFHRAYNAIGSNPGRQIIGDEQKQLQNEYESIKREIEKLEYEIEQLGQEKDMLLSDQEKIKEDRYEELWGDIKNTDEEEFGMGWQQVLPEQK